VNITSACKEIRQAGGRQEVPDCFQPGRANLSFFLQRKPDFLSGPDAPNNSCWKSGLPRRLWIRSSETGRGLAAGYL
jgi:hypothetical protein